MGERGEQSFGVVSGAGAYISERFAAILAVGNAGSQARQVRDQCGYFFGQTGRRGLIKPAMNGAQDHRRIAGLISANRAGRRVGHGWEWVGVS